MIIIVESGATKSDWRKIDGNGNLVSRSLHHGTNVSSMKMETVKSVLAEGLEAIGATQEDRFYLYTAGVITDDIRKELKEYIKSLVDFKFFNTYTMLQNDPDTYADLLDSNKSIVHVYTNLTMNEQ